MLHGFRADSTSFQYQKLKIKAINKAGNLDQDLHHLNFRLLLASKAV